MTDVNIAFASAFNGEGYHEIFINDDRSLPYWYSYGGQNTWIQADPVSSTGARRGSRFHYYSMFAHYSGAGEWIGANSVPDYESWGWRMTLEF